MNDKPNKIPNETKQTERSGIEGEGSYTATHHYDSGVAKSVEKGDAEKLGQDAKKALEGPEGEELRQAEAAAKNGKTAQR